jgi:hypothetical protein
MKSLPSFLANIRRKFFVWHIEWEIFDRIFPHLQHECDYGYPFDSHEEITQFCEDTGLTGLPFVQSIEQDIAHMPKGYSKAFRYILYRDLKACPQMPSERIKWYQMLARRRVYHEPSDMRLVATCA